MGDTTRIPIRQLSVSATGGAAKHAEHFYRRLPPVKPKYEADEGELIPKPHKIGAVSVALADAQAVKVKAEGATTVSYEATELPTIRFKGHLKISDIEGEDVETTKETTSDTTASEPADEAVPAAAVTENKEVGNEATDDAPGEHVSHVLPIKHLHGRGPMTPHTKAETASLLTNPDGIIAPLRDRIVDRNPEDHTLKVDAPTVMTRSISPWFITVVGISAVMLVVVGLGVSTRVVVERESVAEAYEFTFDRVVDVVRGKFEALTVHSF